MSATFALPAAVQTLIAELAAEDYATEVRVTFRSVTNDFRVEIYSADPDESPVLLLDRTGDFVLDATGETAEIALARVALILDRENGRC